jgi:hypothetical protein
MFPLVANAQPAGALAAPSLANAHTQSATFGVVTDAAAAARQQLPMAVSALGAPVAYHPDTLQSRQAQTERTQQSRNNSPQTELSDASDAQTQARMQQLSRLPAWAQRFTDLPLSQRAPFSALFAAQFFAQEGSAEEAALFFAANETPDHLPAPRSAPPQQAPLNAQTRELIHHSYTHNANLKRAEKPLPKNPQQYVEVRYQMMGRKPGLDRAHGADAYAAVHHSMTPPAAAIDAA